jgi:cysteine dioxygenase
MIERSAPAVYSAVSLIDVLPALNGATLGDDPYADLSAIVADLRISDAELRPFVRFVAGRYTRNLIYRNDRFELLVLCWPDGTGSPIHDHGGSRCFVKVHSGALLSESFTLLHGGTGPGSAVLAGAGSRIFAAGDIDVRDPADDIHRITPVGGPAISLHVYARPLDRSLVFDEPAGTCRLVASRYDSLPGG